MAINIQDLFPEIDKDSLKGIISFVNDDTGIDEDILEKDLFLTGIMRRIQTLPDVDYVFFKGGTCLSKCHHLIDRFSEDCDLFVYTGSRTASHTQEQRLNSRFVNEVLSIFGNEQATDENGNLLGKRGGDYNKMVFRFEKLSGRDKTALKPNLELEVTSSALRDKSCFRINSRILPMQSLIGECLIKNNFLYECERLGLNSFNVQCLLPEKSLCDKISRMVRVSYGDSFESDLIRYMRDIYDIGMMLRNSNLREYVENKAILPDLLVTNLEDSYRSNSHSGESFSKATIFAEPDRVFSIPIIKEQYNDTIKSFVFRKNDAPSINEVITSLSKLRVALELFDDYRINYSKSKKEKANDDAVISSLKPQL